jgi:hypothetical protein
MLTLAALAAGLTLAAGGFLGFWLIWCSPDQTTDTESLTAARKAATTGRWLAWTGVILHLTHGGSASTGMQIFLLAAACAALASWATKANPDTRRPRALPG